VSGWVSRARAADLVGGSGGQAFPMALSCAERGPWFFVLTASYCLKRQVVPSHAIPALSSSLKYFFHASITQSS